MYRFGELNVDRVRRILAGDLSPEPPPPRASRPQLCEGCPHRTVFAGAAQAGLHRRRRHRLLHAGRAAAVRGDGHAASAWAPRIGVGLGLRHVLPPEEARRVVSVIGDSTFVHSGITGLVEMVYNPPARRPRPDHSRQRHHRHDRAAGASRHRPHARPPADRQGASRGPGAALGIRHVHVIDPTLDPAGIPAAWWRKRLAAGELAVIIARRPACAPADRRVSRGAARRQRRPRSVREVGDRHDRRVTNIVVAGLGGQGVLKASDIVADAAFRAGFDVKKSEIHGMSQRGGSVAERRALRRRGAQPDGARRRGGFPGGAGRATRWRSNRRRSAATGGVLIAPACVD